MSAPTAPLARTTLFVPGSSSRMIAKAAQSAADVVCLDLEDAVAPEQKAAARATIVEALQALDFGRRVRMLRINALDTPYAYRDLVDVVEPAGDRLDLIMLPKARGPEDVRFVDTLLSQIELSAGHGRRIGVEAQIETAAGFLWLREIAQSSPRLEALIFGPGDYAASMRMPLASIEVADAYDAAYPGHRWHAVMHAIVAAARANGLRCVDGPYADYQDSTGLGRACQIAVGLGFDGKQCIHPAQLDQVNAAFSPRPDELSWAQEVVAAYDQALAAGRGAVSLGGRMIDAANIRMAQTILQRQRAIEERA